MSDRVAHVGELVSFEYPAANYEHVPPRWERRLVRIDQVLSGPAPQEAIDRDPLLCRRGPLVIGRDECRHGAVRQFYWGRTRRVCTIPEETGTAVAVRGGWEVGAVTEAAESEMPMKERRNRVVRITESARKERFFRITRIRSDGRATIVCRCMREVEAMAYIEACNSRTPITGTRAEASEVVLPGLPGDASGQVQ